MYNDLLIVVGGKDIMRKNIRIIVISALFAAMVFVCTMISVPIPGAGGYVHVGDALIYIAAAILPFPYGVLCAAVGACFADVALGAAVWAPFTLIIKSLMALCFYTKKSKARLLCVHNFSGILFAGVINVVGYYLSEWVLYGNFLSPVASIPYNLMQSFASGILFVLIAGLLDKLRIQKIFNLRW